MEESKKFSLNAIDWKNIGKGLLIAIGGAVCTYLLDTIPGIDFGQYTPVVVAANSILVNIIRKFLSGQQ